MKTLRIDALHAAPAPNLPDTLLAADGRRYEVVGVVTGATTVSVPLADGEATGRRLCVLLGRMIEEPPPESPPLVEKVAGYLSTGTGA